MSAPPSAVSIKILDEDNHTAQVACFKTVELFENILSFLPAPDLLRATGTSRHFKAVYEGSVRLKSIVDPPSVPLEIWENCILTFGSDQLLVRNNTTSVQKLKDKGHIRFWKLTTPYVPNPLFFVPGGPYGCLSVLQRGKMPIWDFEPESSCGVIQLCNPSVFNVQVRYFYHDDGPEARLRRGCLSNRSGVTFADVIQFCHSHPDLKAIRSLNVVPNGLAEMIDQKTYDNIVANGAGSYMRWSRLGRRIWERIANHLSARDACAISTTCTGLSFFSGSTKVRFNIAFE